MHYKKQKVCSIGDAMKNWSMYHRKIYYASRSKFKVMCWKFMVIN